MRRSATLAMPFRHGATGYINKADIRCHLFKAAAAGSLNGRTAAHRVCLASLLPEIDYE